MNKKPCHELVLGMTGSGKTVFSRGALLPAYQKAYPMVIVDTKLDKHDKLWQHADVTVENVRDMRKFLERGQTVHYRIKTIIEEVRWLQFDAICKTVMQFKGGIVTYVNEAGDVMSNTKMPRYFDAMLRKGRSPEHWAIVESQRPSLIVHPNLFNNVNSFWLFKMGAKDRYALEKYFTKEEVARLDTIGDFGYIWTDGNDYQPFSAIPLEWMKDGRRRTDEREPRARTAYDDLAFGRARDAIEKSDWRSVGRKKRSGQVQEGRRVISLRVGDKDYKSGKEPAKDTE